MEDAEGDLSARIKVSEDVDKVTDADFEKTYRIFDKATGKAEADYITVWDETVDETKPLELFDPQSTWKRKCLSYFLVQHLQGQVDKGGQLVYQQPTLQEIQKYCAEQVDTLWDEVKRFENPHNFYVDLSQKLWDIKQDLLRKSR